MPHNRILGALSFERLEQAFVSDLQEAADTSRRIWVLAPTNILCLHLARAAASATDGLMGVRFMTLRDAAAELKGPTMARRGMRPLPRGAAELVLGKALRELPDDAHLAGFRDFPGSVGALARATGLLANSLWSPSALQQAAARMAPRGAQMSGRLRELAVLWQALESFKQQRCLFSNEDLLLEAAFPSDTDGHAPDTAELVFVYGFYDLTPLQRTLVSRIVTAARQARAYLLWDEGGAARGFEYAAPTVEFFKELLGVPQVESLGDVGAQSDLCRLRRGIFMDWPPGADESQDREPPAADGSVRILNCPGETAEAEEVAREVLRRSRVSPSPDGVCVLARTAEEVAADLAEALDRAGVRYYMSEGRPLAGTMAGRILLALLELAESEAERSDVIEFLSVADIPWPQDLHATALDRLSRLAGVVKGWASWPERLSFWAEVQSERARRAELESEGDALRREAELARVAAGSLGEFFQDVRGLHGVATWEEMSRRLGGLAERFIPASAVCRADVLNAVRDLAALDVTGVQADVGRAARLLRQALSDAWRKSGGFQRTGVAFTGIMASRGATSDVVILPRLLEKSFPRQIGLDPLLGDRERDALNGLVAALECGELSLQQRRPEEERYLLRLALGAARRAVVLTYPRMEQDSGRPRILSRFIQQTCDALCERMVRPERIENGDLGNLVARIRLGPLPDAADALDEWEYDLCVHSRAAADQAAGYTGRLSPGFRAALRMDAQRWSQPEFGPYDGDIRDPRLLESLAQKHGAGARAVSPSRLETYSQCPFDYFVRYVLQVEELEKPSQEIDMSALEWGILMHDLFRTVYRQRLTGRRLGDITDAEIRDALALAATELEGLGAAHASARPAAWSAARRKALGQLRRLLELERAKNADASPMRFELAFGPQEEAGPLTLSADGAEALSLRGRIDRVDRTAKDGVQVVDYKTGSSKGYKRNSLEGGAQLQLPLYLLAASGVLGATEGRARYLFTSEQKFVEQYTLAELRSRQDDLRRLMGLIVEGITCGDFFPLPHDARGGAIRCGEHCPSKGVCSPAQEKASSIKSRRGTAPALARLREQRGIR